MKLFYLSRIHRADSSSKWPLGLRRIQLLTCLYSPKVNKGLSKASAALLNSLYIFSTEGEIRLDSQNTADILSMDSKHFWLYWKLDNAHVEQLQLGLADEQEALVKWPVPVTFSPSQITVLRVPESDVEIRYNLSFPSVFFLCQTIFALF